MRDDVCRRIKEFRVGLGLKQADVDAGAELPKNSTSKMERGLREPTAGELIRVAKMFRVPLEAFTGEEASFVAREEAKIVEALRELTFEEYKDVLQGLEYRLYYKAKDSLGKEKIALGCLVSALQKLSQNDMRPRTNIAATVRDRKKG